MSNSPLADLDALLTCLKDDLLAEATATGTDRSRIQARRLDEAHQYFQQIQQLYTAARRQCAGAALPQSCDYHQILHEVEALAIVLYTFHPKTSGADDHFVADLCLRYRNATKGLLDLRTSCEGQSPTRALQAEGTGAGSDPAEGEQAEGIDKQTRQEKIANLPRAIRRAFLAYEAVARKMEKRLEDLEDHEAYEFLKEEGVPEDADDQGELTDYEPPEILETFRKYLSKARDELGERKYTRRQGRSHGKSIVRQDQIEQPEKDD